MKSLGMADLHRNRYVELAPIQHFLDRGFDRETAGRTIARVAFLNELLDSKLPDLYYCLTNDAGLLPGLEAIRSVWRKPSIPTRRSTEDGIQRTLAVGDSISGEVTPADREFGRAFAAQGELISRWITEFMDGLTLDRGSIHFSLAGSKWLRERVEGLYAYWLLGQIQNQPLLITDVLPQVIAPAAPTPHRLPEFHFSPDARETAEDVFRRFKEETTQYEQLASSFLPQRRQGPRDAKVYEKYTKWLYQALVEGESFISIAFNAFPDDHRPGDRRSEVKYGIRKVIPMLQ